MIKNQIKNLKQLKYKYPLELLYIFGSMARGDQHKNSDIDIAFRSKRPLTAKEELNLSLDLKKLLPTDNRPIDLVDLNNSTPLLSYLVATQGKKLYGAPSKDDNFYRSSLKRFIDAKPLFDLTDHYVRSH
jgi:uncharacterized protein